MCNPGKTKAEKACDILSNKGIDKCCEWLLGYGGYQIGDVPGVNIPPDTERAHNVYKSRVFSYDGKTYDLRYENLRSVTFPDGEESYFGDFILRIDSQIVLHTSFSQHEEEYISSVNTIGISPYSIKKPFLENGLRSFLALSPRQKKLRQPKKRQKKKRNPESWMTILIWANMNKKCPTPIIRKFGYCVIILLSQTLKGVKP